MQLSSDSQRAIIQTKTKVREGYAVIYPARSFTPTTYKKKVEFNSNSEKFDYTRKERVMLEIGCSTRGILSDPTTLLSIFNSTSAQK
jgi:hypothetical protein